MYFIKNDESLLVVAKVEFGISQLGTICGRFQIEVQRGASLRQREG
jgi:hypothetical protein